MTTEVLVRVLRRLKTPSSTMLELVHRQEALNLSDYRSSALYRDLIHLEPIIWRIPPDNDELRICWMDTIVELWQHHAEAGGESVIQQRGKIPQKMRPVQPKVHTESMQLPDSLNLTYQTTQLKSFHLPSPLDSNSPLPVADLDPLLNQQEVYLLYEEILRDLDTSEDIIDTMLRNVTPTELGQLKTKLLQVKDIIKELRHPADDDLFEEWRERMFLLWVKYSEEGQVTTRHIEVEQLSVSTARVTSTDVFSGGSAEEDTSHRLIRSLCQLSLEPAEPTPPPYEYNRYQVPNVVRKAFKWLSQPENIAELEYMQTVVAEMDEYLKPHRNDRQLQTAMLQLACQKLPPCRLASFQKLHAKQNQLPTMHDLRVFLKNDLEQFYRELAEVATGACARMVAKRPPSTTPSTSSGKAILSGSSTDTESGYGSGEKCPPKAIASSSLYRRLQA